VLGLANYCTNAVYTAESCVHVPQLCRACSWQLAAIKARAVIYCNIQQLYSSQCVYSWQEAMHSQCCCCTCSKDLRILPLLPPIPLLLLPAGISLVVQDAPSLQDLDGFSRLTRVPGDLQLYLLGSLPNLRGLATLQEVGLNAVIGANGLITTLEGLGKKREMAQQLFCHSAMASSANNLRRYCKSCSVPDSVCWR
jgi:hypothetical protein